MSWRDFRYPHYTPTKPIEVKGGIKSRTKSGRFGKSWWASRWIQTLESFNIGARLARGRSYARSGQVKSIRIDKGEIHSEVQGSRRTPYKVSILVKILTDSQWEKLAKTLAAEAVFLAKLLAGRMPEEIEEAFKAAGISLFPEKRDDLSTDCTCPDWSNPCKHIAAVYYLLGEEFDRDPFLIFKLRGKTREELLELIGGGAISALNLTEEESTEPEPIDPDPVKFWGKENPTGLELGEIEIPKITAALPVRLRGFPFWQGSNSFMNTIKPIYANASTLGIRLIFREVKE